MTEILVLLCLWNTGKGAHKEMEGAAHFQDTPLVLSTKSLCRKTKNNNIRIRQRELPLKRKKSIDFDTEEPDNGKRYILNKFMNDLGKEQDVESCEVNHSLYSNYIYNLPFQPSYPCCNSTPPFLGPAPYMPGPPYIQNPVITPPLLPSIMNVNYPLQEADATQREYYPYTSMPVQPYYHQPSPSPYSETITLYYIAPNTSAPQSTTNYHPPEMEYRIFLQESGITSTKTSENGQQ